MARRALVIFKNKKDVNEVTLEFEVYGDAYPEDFGCRLARFLCNTSIRSGISYEDKLITEDSQGVANGWGCFLAQFTAAFKTRPGGLYITKGIPSEYDSVYQVIYTSEKKFIIMYYENYKTEDEVYCSLSPSQFLTMFQTA